MSLNSWDLLRASVSSFVGKAVNGALSLNDPRNLAKVELLVRRSDWTWASAMLSSKLWSVGGMFNFVAFVPLLINVSEAAAPSSKTITVEHSTRPSPIETTTTYSCKMRPRSFSIVYRIGSKARMTAAIYDGKALRRLDLANVNEYLARFDDLAAIEPECHSSSDFLLVVGSLGKQRMLQYVYWTRTGFTASTPIKIS